MQARLGAHLGASVAQGRGLNLRIRNSAVTEFAFTPSQPVAMRCKRPDDSDSSHAQVARRAGLRGSADRAVPPTQSNFNPNSSAFFGSTASSC